MIVLSDRGYIIHRDDVVFSEFYKVHKIKKTHFTRPSGYGLIRVYSLETR